MLANGSVYGSKPADTTSREMTADGDAAGVDVEVDKDQRTIQEAEWGSDVDQIKESRARMSCRRAWRWRNSRQLGMKR